MWLVERGTGDRWSCDAKRRLVHETYHSLARLQRFLSAPLTSSGSIQLLSTPRVLSSSCRLLSNSSQLLGSYSAPVIFYPTPPSSSGPIQLLSSSIQLLPAPRFLLSSSQLLGSYSAPLSSSGPIQLLSAHRVLRVIKSVHRFLRYGRAAYGYFLVAERCQVNRLKQVSQLTKSGK